MARIPKGYKKCYNRNCRGGQVQQYKEISGRLQKNGKKQCPICKGAGMLPDAAYVRKIRQQADKLERDANYFVGTGQKEKVKKLLGAAIKLRQEADRLEGK